MLFLFQALKIGNHSRSLQRGSEHARIMKVDTCIALFQRLIESFLITLISPIAGPIKTVIYLLPRFRRR